VLLGGDAVIEKTKLLQVGDVRYELHRFDPATGSFILMQLVGAAVKAAQAQGSTEAAAPVKEPPDDPADRVRMLVWAAYINSADFEMHKFVQNKCLAVVSRVESQNGSGEVVIPISNGNGAILPEVRDDVALVLKLETEVMVFNFTDFFAGEGLKELAGKTPPPQTS
jgi:hypothetical protein